MSYLPHQIEASDRVYAVLRRKGVALLAGETRTGKTRTAIRVAEMSPARRVLVLTRKAAIPGWQSELGAVGPSCAFVVVNYEQAAKQSQDFDLLILDESHNFGRAGRPTQRFKTVRGLAYDKPLLCLSGTPMVETTLGIYYQFGVSRFSPFDKFSTFYRFFARYGISRKIRVNGHMVETYKAARPELLGVIKPYVVTLTQDEAGIAHKAQDVLHRVPLDASTVDLIDTVRQDKVVTLNGVDVVCDSDMKERAVVHQIESGALRHEGGHLMLPNTEMVDYIRRTWGDRADVAVMCHYLSTRAKIERHLPNVHLYSSDGHAEGVDLSHYEHFVIVNSGYSGAKFVQRRDRIVNLRRATEAKVHHLVAEGGLSERVYRAVSEKRDFNLDLYRRYARTRPTAKNPEDA